LPTILIVGDFDMRLVEALMEYLGCDFGSAMIYAKRILVNWDKIEESAKSETVEMVRLDKK
jgi:hypothetical protein